MIPGGNLSNPTVWSPYLVPDGEVTSDTEDYNLGGVGLSDPSQGLEYQNWHGFVTSLNRPSSAVWLESSNTPAVQIMSSPYITWMRFTFDQNMHPFVTFISQEGSGYYWWDPQIPGNVKFIFPSALGITFCACGLDDKRFFAALLGESDIILSYVRNNNLCYRQQRDRYGTEYILAANINLILANARVSKVGMNLGGRLQFYLQGDLYR